MLKYEAWKGNMINEETKEELKEKCHIILFCKVGRKKEMVSMLKWDFGEKSKLVKIIGREGYELRNPAPEKTRW